MHVTDKITKKVLETKYLTADNVERYRSIMRIFYENYEKLKYWLYQEDIYIEMTRDEYFKDYRMEQCQQDLAMLVEWKNLITIQDTRKVASIEEFKNKKFRYQMSEYSVEIERFWKISDDAKCGSTSAGWKYESRASGPIWFQRQEDEQLSIGRG